MSAPRASERWVRALPGLAFAVLAWLACDAVAMELYWGMPLGLGSFQGPTAANLAALSITGTFATFGALGLTYAGWQLLGDAQRERLAASLRDVDDRRWSLLCAVVSAALAAQARTWILRNGPISDDESAYLLAAQILASGRVWIPSDPDSVFFENVFLVNDGRFYTQYPLGWPALMAPFAMLGIGGYANVLYGALTVPAIFAATHELLGVREARLATALYCVSPMHVLAAATAMSHTSCAMALAWLLCAVLRARRGDARPRHDALVALAFCLLFFIRPSVAFAAGGPLLIGWAIAWARRTQGRALSLAAFVVPSVALAAVFFAINWAQTGSPTKMAYVRALEFIAETGYRFTSVTPNEGTMPNLELGDPMRRLAIVGAALLRLDHDLLAWPASLVLVPFAALRRGLGLVWSSAAGMLLGHSFSANVGIDGFAPVHFFELGVPALILIAAALGAISDRARDAGPVPSPRRAALPFVATAALVIASLAISLPPRVAALASIAEDITLPRDTASELALHDALVFAPVPFATACSSSPNRHWVFFRPNNAPALDDDVLWVNHVTIAEDRRFARRFPARTAYLMRWTRSCEVEYTPIDAPELDDVPPAAGLPEDFSAARAPGTRRGD